MAKEFGVDGAFGYSTAVHCHVGAVLAYAIVVYYLRKTLFAHTTFARY